MTTLIKKVKGKIFGNTNRDFLFKIVPKNAICAEIGTWKGDFAKKIIKKTNPSKLYLIDPYKFFEEYKDAWYGGVLAKRQQDMDQIHDSVKLKFERAIENGKVEILRMSSLDAYKNFNDNQLDWIYIDGNHTYEFVKQDILNFYPKVRVDGFITGDDYAGLVKNGVSRAVDDFIESHKDRIEIVAIKNRQFVLKKLG